MSPLRRIWVLTVTAATLWVLVVGFSYLWNVRNIRSQMVELAEVEAKANLKRDLAFRLWSAGHGGVYLRVDDKTKPSPFLSHIPDRDVVMPNGGMLTLQNPAASLRELKEMQSGLYGELARITAFKYMNPNNAPDEWEKKALQIVDATREDFSEVTTINGKTYLRRMQPMLMEQGCMKCHAWSGIKVGGLRGGTDIAIPLENYQALSLEAEKGQAVTHGGIALLGLLVIGFTSRRSWVHATESLNYQRVLEHLAREDGLTGLLNRRSFLELAEQELVRTLRYDRPMSLLMVDIDLFKDVNDRYGHAVGDLALQKLSDVFRQVVREVDSVCRMGGEEFALLLPETTTGEAIDVAERLRLKVQALVIPASANQSACFTVSVGVSSLKGATDTIDQLLNRADRALYQAKDAGRNRVCAAA